MQCRTGRFVTLRRKCKLRGRKRRISGVCRHKAAVYGQNYANRQKST